MGISFFFSFIIFEAGVVTAICELSKTSYLPQGPQLTGPISHFLLFIRQNVTVFGSWVLLITGLKLSEKSLFVIFEFLSDFS